MLALRHKQINLPVLCLIFIFFSACAFGNPIIPIPTQPQQPIFTPGAPTLDADSYILIDASSGKILAEKNPDQHMAPASLTKLMSLYIISAAIKMGQIHMDDKVRISTKAWKTEGSRMFVKAGEEVPVKDLLKGVVVASGNDATVALAEYIAGTEDAFVSIMNQQAQMLGLKNTNFIDSTGLPNENHYSTSRDLAVLTQMYIKNFPEDYSLYAEKWFTFNNIRQANRNRLLWRYQYADGLKTGHTQEAGYCLVGSAKKDGMRLITVVMGDKSEANRTEDTIRLMTYGFRFFETHKLYNAITSLAKARIWEGEKNHIPIGVMEDLFITVPIGQYKRIQTEIVLHDPLKAPITKGQIIGKINILLNNETLASKTLIALDDNPSGNFLRRATDSVRFNIHKYFSKSDEKVNTG